MPAYSKWNKRSRTRQRAADLFAALILLCVPVSGIATTPESGCMLHLAAEPLELDLVYDAFALRGALQTTRLELENLSDRPCRILIEPQGQAAGRLQMNLADTTISGEIFVGEGRRSLREVASGRPLEFLMPANGNQQLEVGVRLQQGAFPRPGLYSNGLSFALRDRDSGALVLEELLVRMRIEVPTHVQLNLAGSNAGSLDRDGGHVVDFGLLRSGAQRDLNLQVRANQAYRLTLRSENGGQLRPKQNFPGDGIGYQMTIRGRSTDLASPLEWSMPRPPTADGVNLPVQIRISEIAGRLAGTYEDVVHVSVMAHH